MEESEPVAPRKRSRGQAMIELATRSEKRLPDAAHSVESPGNEDKENSLLGFIHELYASADQAIEEESQDEGHESSLPLCLDRPATRKTRMRGPAPGNFALDGQLCPAQDKDDVHDQVFDYEDPLAGCPSPSDTYVDVDDTTEMECEGAFPIRPLNEIDGVQINQQNQYLRPPRCTKVTTGDCERVWGLLSEASRLLYEQCQPEKARELLLSAADMVKHESGSEARATIHCLRSAISVLLDQFDRAEADARAAINVAPTSWARPHYHLAEALYRSGRISESMSEYKLVLRIANSYAERFLGVPEQSSTKGGTPVDRRIESMPGGYASGDDFQSTEKGPKVASRSNIRSRSKVQAARSKIRVKLPNGQWFGQGDTEYSPAVDNSDALVCLQSRDLGPSCHRSQEDDFAMLQRQARSLEVQASPSSSIGGDGRQTRPRFDKVFRRVPTTRFQFM